MLAHEIDGHCRSKDVVVVENITFESLLLSPNVLKGLTKNGFKKPSPIQMKAIPVGRCGFDLIVKSKSGTGKTLVFSIIALEALKTKLKNLEVLILSPTREIAVQSQDVIKRIGCLIEGLHVESFIGGLSLAQDKDNCKLCHIAVGTPGRIKHLINENVLKTDAIRLFILDEADKLLEQSFRNDINEIYNSLPSKKQIITTSATYPNQLDEFLSKYMLSPTHITAELDSPLLLGLKQFVVTTKYYANVSQQMKDKNLELTHILTTISFTQCLIFSNYQTKAESLSNILNQGGWPSTYISAAQSQVDRLVAVNQLKDFKCRIMISTDLTARGIDAANVDLVINYDLPCDAMTYLHRMGRAGRYGSTGVCINLASAGAELEHLQKILGYIGGSSLTIPKLPKNVGSISELLKTEIPVEEHVSSKISTEMDKSLSINSKMYETKPERKSKNINKDEIKPKKPKHFEITNLLNDSKNEEDEIRKQISDMDTKSILDSLLTQSFKVKPKTDTDKEERVVNKGFNATAVLELLSESCSKFTKTEPEDNISKKIDSQEQDREKLLVKNKALLNISRLLSNPNSPEEQTSIEQHLSFLKAQDQREVSDLSKKNISDILNILEQKEDCISKVEVKADEESTLQNIQSFDTRDARPSTSKAAIGVKSFDIENIFEFGYKHLVKSDDDGWKEVLAKIDKTKITDEDIATDNEYGEYGDGGDFEEDFDYNNAGTEDEEGAAYNNMTIADDYERVEIMKWVPVNNETRTERTSDDEITKEVDVMKWLPVESTKDTKHSIQPTYLLQSQENSEDNEQFSSYFQECSNNLWQNGLTFDNVQSFDEWFCYEWEPQLYAVRNYVQQNVYVSEMAKFQNSRSTS